jgi:hypothetical protein
MDFETDPAVDASAPAAPAVVDGAATSDVSAFASPAAVAATPTPDSQEAAASAFGYLGDQTDAPIAAPPDASSEQLIAAPIDENARLKAQPEVLAKADALAQQLRELRQTFTDEKLALLPPEQRSKIEHAMQLGEQGVAAARRESTHCTDGPSFFDKHADEISWARKSFPDDRDALDPAKQPSIGPESDEQRKNSRNISREEAEAEEARRELAEYITGKEDKHTHEHMEVDGPGQANLPGQTGGPTAPPLVIPPRLPPLVF